MMRVTNVYSSNADVVLNSEADNEVWDGGSVTGIGFNRTTER